ncbi:MAG: SDR family oxidoreductase [Pseudomonadota bacterium]|nr:SDR family oxidoreductase [Pseudomonadota bacterium]
MWLDQMGRQGMDYWVRAAGMGLGSAIAVAELGERFWGRLVDDQRASIDLAFRSAAEHYRSLAGFLSPNALSLFRSTPSRLALVTGARGILGTTVCERLAESGFRVAATYPPSEATHARQRRDHHGRHGDITVVECDIGRFEDCARLARWAERRYGAVDILVHCTAPEARCAESEHWRAVLDAGLDGLFNLARNLIPGMSKRRYGRIITIVSSGSAGTPTPQVAAAKAGILGFTRALAREVQDQGITVNTVSAGCLETAPEDASHTILRLLNLNCLDQPEEIARAAAFLAADEQCTYTGHDVASRRRASFAEAEVIDLGQAQRVQEKRRSCDRLFAS